MKFKYLTTAPLQTKKLGEILAKEVLKTKLEKGTPKENLRHPAGQALIIGLEGDLGGGKTTFLQGFAKGLGIKEKILSPTFVIIKKFKIQKQPTSWRAKIQNFYHIDCYRLEKPKEILDLGFKEIISNPENIVTVEWAERIQEILPAGTVILKFEFIGQKTRKITVGFKNGC
jgi:tRNA threonylcarbamoyladenosine biosynthesis protein TsaE